MKLLVAEDEKTLAKAIKAILVKEHYLVDVANDGREALDYIESVEYDGLILDIMMPLIDGITLTRTIREKGISTPVLLLTAKSEIDDKIEGLDAGADDYLTKPFDARELCARVRAMLRRQPSIEEDVLEYEDIKLDRSGYSLKKGKNSIRLGNKEYQLMELFMRNPNQVFSTERIMEKVWGYDSDAEINVVWVNISSLRKKLSSLKSKVLIKAVRGEGYCLEKKND